MANAVLINPENHQIDSKIADSVASNPMATTMVNSSLLLSLYLFMAKQTKITTYNPQKKCVLKPKGPRTNSLFSSQENIIPENKAEKEISVFTRAGNAKKNICRVLSLKSIGVPKKIKKGRNE